MTDDNHVEGSISEIESFIRKEKPRAFLTLKPEPEPVPVPEPVQIEKIDHTLLPWDALEEVSRVLMHGREKYAAWYWVEHPHRHTDLLAKVQRHIVAFQRGEDIDPSSGRHHIACAICDLLFLQSNVLHGVGTDDRFKR
jgi:Domain of unknown function (DUF5664)